MSPSPSTDRAVAAWLFLCAGLVFALAVLGGVTRLAGAGLSMVRWEPVRGIVPPLDEAAWAAELAAYRESPEARIRNVGIGLAAFQRIYWIEWAHRLLGRLVGVAFFGPLVAFAGLRRIRGRDVALLTGILALGGAQGAVGWLMVASGLVDRPRVSPYRLALHLGLGAVLLAALLRQGLRWRDGRRGNAPARLATASRILGGAIGLGILSGAFMAGTGAGHAYRTFPLIGGRLVPDGLAALSPWWRNPFENPVAIHLVHRSAAFLVLGLVAWLAWRVTRVRRNRRLGGPLRLLVGLVVAQIALGATTLLLGVPTALASLHQATGLALLAAWVLFHFRLAPPQLRPAAEDFPKVRSGAPAELRSPIHVPTEEALR